jgi:hypothetical protein
MKTITRRQFVSQSAKTTGVIAAGAAALTAAQRARAQSAHDKVVLALIGAGGRGQSLVAGMSVLDHVEFKYICDVNQQRGRHLMTRTSTR